MRVGLFGGSFDPPHLGHVAVAAAAANAFALDRVLFAPVGLQPLKRDALIAGYADRRAMVDLACEGDARFALSDVDAPRQDGAPNFTISTLETLTAELPGAELFAILGADAFLDIGRWKEPSRLFELAQWIVVTRPGFSLSSDGVAAGARVHPLETVHMDVSATEVRARLRMGQDCAGLIAPAVLEYIAARGLYRDAS